jgi:hypothetical protein
VATTTIGDSVFAVREARGVVDTGSYDFVWTAGALLIAVAAGVPVPGGADGEEGSEAGVTGMRAIVLALIAQALAIGIQIYAVFREVGRSERIITVVVLVVASVQIILTRPRARGSGSTPESPEVGLAPPRESAAADLRE